MIPAAQLQPIPSNKCFCLILHHFPSQSLQRRTQMRPKTSSPLISFGLVGKNRMTCQTKRVNPKGSLAVSPRAAAGAGRGACSGSSCGRERCQRGAARPAAQRGKDQAPGSPVPLPAPRARSHRARESQGWARFANLLHDPQTRSLGQ